MLNTIVQSYKNNFWFILVSSFLFLFSFLLLFLSPAETYLSLGSVNVRILGIPHFSILDILILVLIYGISLFLFSDAITNLNIIVKSKRTLNKIPEEIIKGFSFSWKIFFIYTFVFLFTIFINLLTFQLPFHNYLFPLISFFIYLLVFFVPPAIVIDNLSISQSISMSIKLVKKSFIDIILFVFLFFSILFGLEYLFFFLMPVSISKYLMVLINSFLLLPLFTILQTELYMKKYPLSP